MLVEQNNHQYPRQQIDFIYEYSPCKHTNIFHFVPTYL